MLGSISPLGERARRSRWTVTVAAYFVGSVGAGAAFGAALGGLGRLVLGGLDVSETARLVTLAAMLAVGLAFDAGVLRLGLPGPERQVDDRWLTRYRGWVYGIGFGFQLGLGVTTVVATSAVYAAFGAAFLSSSVGGGLIVGGTFGLARAATLLATARIRTPAQVIAVDATFQRWDPPSRRTAHALMAVALLAAVAAAAASW